MSKKQRKDRQARESFAEPDPEPAARIDPLDDFQEWQGSVYTPDSFEGKGMEDLDAALEPDEPAPAEDTPDLSDPDAKLAWMELMTEAVASGDGETVAALNDLAARQGAAG